MNITTLIELVGYAGSILVVLSMLMTSLKKLRIVNTAGCVVFATYALIIKSYPTAGMQVALIIINMINLYKLTNTKRDYKVVELPVNDSILTYYAHIYREDIEKFFPGVFESINTQDNKTKVYLVLNGPTAAGVMLAEKNDSTLDVKLDYTTPAYRDTSVGKFLYDYLAKNEIKQLCVKTQVPEHGIYLKKMGFEEKTGLYKKTL